MADKIRQVKFKHRFVLEFESTCGTGYNGDIDFLINEAKKDRAHYSVVLKRDVELNHKPELRISEVSSTISAELPV